MRKPYLGWEIAMWIRNALVFQRDFRFHHADVRTLENQIVAIMPRKEDDKEILGDNRNIIKNEVGQDLQRKLKERLGEDIKEEIIDGSDLYLIPGLMDIHLHGCVHKDFCDANEASIYKMAQYQLNHGITNLCLASMTLAQEQLEKICQTAAKYVRAQHEDGADLVGINLEGPFISAKKKGAQNSDYIIEPNLQVLDKLQRAAEGLIKVVAIAPEKNHAMNFIQEASKDYVVSIAHTMADYETSMEAFHNGASHVTHLFNAMPAFNHRETGVVGAAYDTPQSEVEMICDGIHISPTMIRVAYQLFGDDRIILISDSMEATGMPDGEYSLGGQVVYKKGVKAALEDGTIAGSVTNLFDCMREAIKMGVPLESAIKDATYTPARSIGQLEDYGTIEVGKQANMVLMTQQLEIVEVIHQGIRINNHIKRGN